MSDGETWLAWEPGEWVAARGAGSSLESAHFCVRWGSGTAAFAASDAQQLLRWLEAAWALLCSPQSPQRFVTPYSTRGWCADGTLRKLNVYVTSTGLAPCPGDAAYAHQGTFVEVVGAVRHATANPEGKLHHSYLALQPNAARSEATVVHELAHVLQMHTGGFVNSSCVGYQWEAHAEYCVHLYRPCDAGWAHSVAAFLASAHLPPGATRSQQGGADGRQYAVWPLFAWLDRRFGAGTAHGLWAADFAQRCDSGASRDGLSALAARLGGWRALGDALADFALAVATAHFGADPAADAAVRASCDVLAPARMAKLRAPRGGDAFRCDAARPLKQHGVNVYRLELSTDDPDAALEASVGVSYDASATANATLRYALVGFDAATGERYASAVRVCGAEGDNGIAFPAAPRAGIAWLLAVTAAPDAPVDVPWGIEPDALPTFGYAVRLRGCVPHADSSPPPPPPSLPLLHATGRELHVPTGLANLLPCARDAGAGASATHCDLRSGEPGARTLVWLRHAVAGPARISAASFAYRVVVGYSGNEGSPGPRFELVCSVESCDDADDASDLRVLYASPEFGARPWHYDAVHGGAPDNYCPRVEARAACDVRVASGQQARLGLRFVNGCRNIHLQGGDWPNAAQPCDLQLCLTLDAA